METFQFVQQPVLSFFLELHFFFYLVFIYFKRDSDLSRDAQLKCVCKEGCVTHLVFVGQLRKNTVWSVYGAVSLCGFHKKALFIEAVIVRRSLDVRMRDMVSEWNSMTLSKYFNVQEFGYLLAAQGKGRRYLPTSKNMQKKLTTTEFVLHLQIFYLDRAIFLIL